MSISMTGWQIRTATCLMAWRTTACIPPSRVSDWADALKPIFTELLGPPKAKITAAADRRSESSKDGESGVFGAASHGLWRTGDA